MSVTTLEWSFTMEIDLRTEELLSLAEAASRLPAVEGRRPHVATLWRWCRQGVRGVRLEHIRIGHRICTTQAAVDLFVRRLTDLANQAARTDTKPEPNPDRQELPF